MALLLVITLGVSSNDFNADATHGLFAQFVRWLSPWPLSSEQIEHWHELARKGGHFVGYAIIALSLARAFRVPHPGRRAGLTALASLAWATLDEYNQSFLPQRTGSVADIGLDFAGATSALAALSVVYLRRARGGAFRRPVPGVLMSPSPEPAARP